MSKVIFGLYDEAGYMQLLADYLEKNSSKAECHLFTGKDTLEEYLKCNELEVLLLGEEVDYKHIDYLEHVKNQLILTEEPIEQGEAIDGRVFKYQPAGKICEEILNRFLKQDFLEKEKHGFKRETKFYGIYRLFENGPSTLEEVLGKEVPERNTLILDMGLFDGNFSSEEKGQGMSEVLFYLKQKSEKAARKLPGVIREWNGRDYISAVEDYRDLYGIARKEMDLLFRILTESTVYENVIFDVGFLGETTLYLLERCEYVFLKQPQNQWEENQRDGFIRLLKRENMDKVLNKLRYVTGKEG